MQLIFFLKKSSKFQNKLLKSTTPTVIKLCVKLMYYGMLYVLLCMIITLRMTVLSFFYYCLWNVLSLYLFEVKIDYSPLFCISSG